MPEILKSYVELRVKSWIILTSNRRHRRYVKYTLKTSFLDSSVSFTTNVEATNLTSGGFRAP